METGNTPPRIEEETQEDRRLAAELEALYHRIANLDRSEPPQAGSAAPPQGENRPLSASAPLPACTPVTGPPGDDRSVELRPMSAKELTEKLNRIRDAYQRLLTDWPYA